MTREYSDPINIQLKMAEWIKRRKKYIKNLLFLKILAHFSINWASIKERILPSIVLDVYKVILSKM